MRLGDRIFDSLGRTELIPDQLQMLDGDHHLINWICTFKPHLGVRRVDYTYRSDR